MKQKITFYLLLLFNLFRPKIEKIDESEKPTFKSCYPENQPTLEEWFAEFSVSKKYYFTKETRCSTLW